MILLTIEEFAFFTGRTEASVRWSIHIDSLKSVKHGHHRLIPATELPFYDSETRKHLYL